MLKVTTRTLIFIVYFLGLFLVSKFSHLVNLNYWKQNIIDLLLWLSGAFLGNQFLKIDQLIYSYITYPKTPKALKIQESIQEHQPVNIWRILSTQIDKQRSVFYSVLFQACWVPVAFFALTSTASVFGEAFVMAIGLHLLMEEWGEILAHRELNWLFWQIKRQVTPQEQKLFLWVMTCSFGVLTLLLL
jgi:hypothetical protein